MELQREDILMYGGVAIFIIFVLYDILDARTRGALWLPSTSLVLYGLILQLVGELEVQNVSISGAHRQNQVKNLLRKQLSIGSARLTLCVFVGYLLPGMATIAYRGVWTTIAVLLISLSTHIATECFVANQFYKTGNVIQVRNQSGMWLIASGGILLPLLFSFVMLLFWAIFIGKFYRDNLSRRVAVILSQNSNDLEMQWENVKEEMLKSWIVARVCQPEYILTRSPFSAGLAVVVTFCVVFFGIKVFWLRSLLNQRSSLFIFQSIFIVVGWIVILYRWLVSVFYCGLFRESLTTRPGEVGSAGGVFVTPFMYLIYSSHAAVKTKLETVLRVLRYPVLIGLVKILISLIVMLIRLILSGLITIALVPANLILCCWVMSVGVFDNKVMRKLFKVDTKLEKLWSGDFGNYKEALESLRMPGEAAASLGIANERPFHHLKHCMEKAYEEGGRCQELVQVIGNHSAESTNPLVAVDELVEPLPGVKKYFPGLKEPLWSLTARSLLDIIIDVSPAAAYPMDYIAVENAMSAYNQAYEFMNVVGCPENIAITVDFFGSSNLEAFLNSIASRIGWGEINESYKKWKSMRRARPEAEPALRLEGALGMIRKRHQDAERILKDKHMLEDVPSAAAQGVVWTTVAPSYSDYKVCTIILADADSYSSVEELREGLLNSLKNVISSSVLEFPGLLLKSTRDWVAEFAEGKIHKAAIMLARACGIIDAAKNTQEGTLQSTTIEF